MLALGGLLTASACGSSSTEGTGGGHAGPPGGPISGAADAHCGPQVQPTSQAACTASGTGGAGGTGAGTGGAGGTGAGTGGAGGGDEDTSDYGATMVGSEGDDDECKYHLKWTSTPIYENEDVTFTLTITSKVDGSPATEANPEAEVFLNEIHPAPEAGEATEGPSGTYTIGPVRFDAPGKWTVRFHLYDECSELNEDSPHGHAGFYVNVP
jgi:hypothetical protein